ncbi:hypothetical protein FSP39_023019 [Pinctada imbricata]|uniref:Voltage-gated hydrogen channel 1 n=1 Tax=Pinctada imbricata TaxID=66713 RepID=A0AA88XPG4_PINIB|nr:hypothetical protein FSP39_023019 [Pinctada imbricata]
MEGFHKLHDDLEKVIEKDDSTSSITTDSDDKHEFRTVRQRLNYVLHTNKFQIIIVCFVILDCLLVISELLLDMKIIQVTGHQSELAPRVLHYCSVGVLSLFIIEIFVRIYAYRLDFFRHKMEMFDAVVVVTSFVLDIVFRDNDGPESGAGLLVVLRLWRVTRILNGIVMSVKKQAEKKIQREKRLRQACEQELTKFREYCTAQEQEIELLRGMLRKHGIEFGNSDQQPPVISTIDVVAEVNQIQEEKPPVKHESPSRNETHVKEQVTVHEPPS